MAFVSSCPKNEEEYMAASKKRGCGYDLFNRSQYICLPNKEKTSLVEICYNEQMGLREKGNCLEATIGKLIEINCQNFTYGCPRENFYDNEIYRYPACQNINRKQQCYVMDPSCPNQVSDDKTNNNDAIIYTCGVLGGLLVLSVAVLLFILLKRRNCRSEYNEASQHVDDGHSRNNSEEYNEASQHVDGGHSRNNSEDIGDDPKTKADESCNNSIDNGDGQKTNDIGDDPETKADESGNNSIADESGKKNNGDGQKTNDNGDGQKTNGSKSN